MDPLLRLLRHLRLPIVLLAVLIATQTQTTGTSLTNCSGSNEEDIQNCLDSGTEVYLEQGTYNLNDKIRFRSDDKLLTSVGGKSILRAGAYVSSILLQTQDASGYEISELIVDGNKGNRDSTARSTAHSNGTCANVELTGYNFHVHHIDTINAICGSGMVVFGDNYELNSIYAADNGEESPVPYWADGITVSRCDSGYVHNNAAVNNTDIGIVVFHGENCTLIANVVVNDERYAFAGLKIGDDFGHGDTLAGGSFQDNSISSGYNLLSFGIMVGNHPWTGGSGTMYDVGYVRYNEVTGAVVNLAVDGIGAGTITNNVLSSAQGNAYYYCSYSGDVTYGDIGSATVQAGTCKIQHGGCGCQ